jgi:hypothetical protein
VLPLGAGLASVSLGLSILLTGGSQAAYFVTHTRMWELALGGMLALLTVRWAGLPRAAVHVGRWSGAALILCSAVTYSGTTPFPSAAALLPVVGSVLVLGAGSSGVPSATLGSRTAAWVGDHSYAIYLWHWPLIVLWEGYSGGDIGLLDGSLILVLTVVLSWVTKRVVEDPVRTSRAFASRRRGLALLLSAGIPVALVSTHLLPEPAQAQAPLAADAHPGAAAVAGAMPSVTSSLETALPRPENAKADRPGYYDQGCEVAIEAPGTVACEFGDRTDPVRTVALVGDSKAGQWLPALEVIAAKRHWRIVTYLRSRCPWSDVLTTVGDGDPSPYRFCQEWGRDVLERLVDEPPDLLLTADRPVVGTPDHPQPDARAFSAIAQGMTAYWSRMKAAGVTVVAIRETPEMGMDVPDCLSTPGTGLADCTRPASAALAQQPPTVQATELSNGDVPLITMNDLLCPDGACQPVLGDVTVYRDAHHLTRSYALSMAPYLDDRLVAAGVVDQ